MLSEERTATLNRQKQTPVLLLKRQYVSRLRQIERQLKCLDTETARNVKVNSMQARKFEILTSVQEISVITAVALLAEKPEIGSLDAKADTSLAGLAPVARQSGTRQGRSLVHGSRRKLCRALSMPAVGAVAWNPDIARKYHQVDKPPKVAIAAVMRNS